MSWLCPRCDATFVDRSGSCTSCGVPLVDDMRGRVLAGRYRLESVVGTGAQDSAVWKGWQMSFERPVAVKIMPAGEAIAAERFSRGAKIASMLAHPNITTVHDYGVTDDGKVFLVMELLEGHVLRSELRDGKPMPVDRALHIANQVLRALEDAHAHSVVHRDLKPDNLFLTHRAGDPDFVKVLDFGIAKFFAAPPPDDADSSTLDGQITRGWQLCGTPLYMAPEQISGEAVDGRTDIYALGIVLYQMLCGRVPFKAKTQYAVLSQHLRDPPPSIAEVRGDDGVPEVMEQVVRRALAKSRDDRFQTARDMRLALRDVQKMLGLKVEMTSESDRRRQTTLPAMQTMHGEPPPATEQRRRWPVMLLVLLAMFIGALGMHFAMDSFRAGVAVDEPEDDTRSVASSAEQARAATAVGGGHQDEASEAATGAAVGEVPVTETAPGAVQVTLTSIPSGARASLDGEELGTTPFTAELPPGDRHEITFEADGHAPTQLTVDLSGAAAGATRAAAVRLEQAPGDEASQADDPNAGAGGADGAQGSETAAGEPSAADKASTDQPSTDNSATEKTSGRRGRGDRSARRNGRPSGDERSKRPSRRGDDRRAAGDSEPAGGKKSGGEAGAAGADRGSEAATAKSAGQAPSSSKGEAATKKPAGDGGIQVLGGGASKKAPTRQDTRKPKIQLLDSDNEPAKRPPPKKVKVQVLGD